MNNTLLAPLSLLMIVPVGSAAAAQQAPLRVATLGEYTAQVGGHEVLGGVTIDENGIVTYRDPVGAPTRIEASLSVDGTDDVDRPVGIGDYVEGIASLGDAVSPAVATTVGEQDNAFGSGEGWLDGALRMETIGDLRSVAVFGSAGVVDDAAPAAGATWTPRFDAPLGDELRDGSAGDAQPLRLDWAASVTTRSGVVPFPARTDKESFLPEPPTWLTMILGFAVIGFALRRKTVLRFV